MNRTGTILIVDDTPSNVLLLERLLAGWGYHTRSATHGAAALTSARDYPPDLILLDINMPGMTGYEVCVQLKAGSATREIPVIFISALHDAIDKVMAFSVGGVDYVTIPFQFEEVVARIQTHMRLRQLEKHRDDLTHMIVHDLRNPLTSIFGCLNRLKVQDGMKLAAGTQEFVSVAQRSAGEMLEMISSILDVNKMDAGEMTLRRESCDLVALVEEVVASFRPAPGKRVLAVDVHESTAWIRVDRVLIRRVFQNLIGNALKYSPDEGVIDVTLRSNARQIRVDVRDGGPGVALENHGRIFEKYGQVELRQNRLGTGLGLPFCKLVVDAHGGEIGVTSTPGSGSTFWVIFKQDPVGYTATTVKPLTQKEPIHATL